MRGAVKRVLATRLGWSVATMVRPHGVTVLMYHRVNPTQDSEYDGVGVEQFGQQMLWLRDHCDPIPPEGLESAIDTDSRRPAVLVTFDDGYRDYYDQAYPILKSLDIPALVFVATRFIDEGGMIWTDVIARSMVMSPCDSVQLPWNGRVHSLASADARALCRLESTSFLKAVPDGERLDWQAELLKRLEVDEGHLGLERQMLTWDEVRATMPLTRYGGHTHSHPILSQLDPQAIDLEIRTCRDRLVSELGVLPRYFAYPNGRAQDFSEVAVESLKECGFTHAFTTIPGLHRRGGDVFRIHRQPTGCSTIGDFASLVFGRG